MNKTYSDDSILGRAYSLYDSMLKAQVETPNNIGKFIAIDVDSGDYEIGRDAIRLHASLKSRHETMAPVLLRIGYPAAFQRGYSMTYHLEKGNGK